jgi:hypothetical protein
MAMAARGAKAMVMAMRCAMARVLAMRGAMARVLAMRGAMVRAMAARGALARARALRCALAMVMVKLRRNRMSDELTEVGGDGIRRSFDEHYDTVRDVAQIWAAMSTIHKQARRIEELEAEIKMLKNED